MKKRDQHLIKEEHPPQEKTETGAEELRSEAEIETEALQTKIAELEQSVASYKDQLLRKAAEFENYKKRVENDFAALARFSNEDLITQLLPILDDFARSLKAGKENPDLEAFYKGIELMYNKFLRILDLQGVKAIQSVGKPFDVFYHDAVMEIPRHNVPHHTVVEEVEKGYTLHGKVIRHAKVVLSSATKGVEQTQLSSDNTDPTTDSANETDPERPPDES